MSDERWTPAELPDLTGVTAVVTGANSGLGFEACVELGRHGALVLMACRDPGRGDEALGQVRVQAPGSAVRLSSLDLADLGSVRAFAERLLSEHAQIDLLINNAGVMAVPQRTTADGFELQFGTNHLGHFALTGLLLPGLLRGRLLGGAARVVTVSSNAHLFGRLHRDDLMLARSYAPWRAYGQSKLANLLFAAELERRAEAAGGVLASLAAHPGYAATNLSAVGPLMSGRAWQGQLIRFGERLIAQSARQGAWPVLRAAADPRARGGQYYGPGSLGGWRGYPRPVSRSGRARDAEVAQWLWQRSVELTGVDYATLAPVA